MCENEPTNPMPNEINNKINFQQQYSNSHQKSNNDNCRLRSCFASVCSISLASHLIMHLVCCVTRNNDNKIRTYKLHDNDNSDGEQNINL